MLKASDLEVGDWVLWESICRPFEFHVGQIAWTNGNFVLIERTPVTLNIVREVEARGTKTEMIKLLKWLQTLATQRQNAIKLAEQHALDVAGEHAIKIRTAIKRAIKDSSAV